MTKSIFTGAYEVTNAYIVSKDGKRKSFPLPGATMTFLPTAPTVESERVIESFNSANARVGLSLGSWEIHLDNMDETFETLLTGFTDTTPDHIYRLEADGKVSIYMKIVDKDGNELVRPRWYFVNVIDRAIWRYALRTGLQLEDAIGELNREYRNATFKWAFRHTPPANPSLGSQEETP